MDMKEHVFNVMTARETEENKRYLRDQMGIFDAMKTPSYTLTTDIATYVIKRAIDRYGDDLTDQYGTQYEVTYKGK